MIKTNMVIKPFLDENFLLENRTAEILFHDYAANQPIFDYHNHLPPQEISENKQFENITQIWLKGDHYKWRAMRAQGIEEQYITGKTSDWGKFEKVGEDCVVDDDGSFLMSVDVVGHWSDSK